jgi:SAM-dependent methyltransferase
MKGQVDPGNAGQAAAWDGAEGAYWADNADRYDRAVAAFHSFLMDGAAIGEGEAVLDIGCGTGQTTRDAARRASSGRALGIDLSTQMLELARQRSIVEGIDNVDYEHGDAQVHPFEPHAFDLVLSRTGAMFFADPVAAFANIGSAVKPGGRLALLTWQPITENEWLPSFGAALAAGRDLPMPPPHAPGPFGLSDPDRVRAILGDAGFTDVDLEPKRGEMWFGEAVDDAFTFVLGQLGWMLADADEPTKARAQDNLRETLTAHETADGVLYGAAAWLIRARR